MSTQQQGVSSAPPAYPSRMSVVQNSPQPPQAQPPQTQPPQVQQQQLQQQQQFQSMGPLTGALSPQPITAFGPAAPQIIVLGGGALAPQKEEKKVPKPPLGNMEPSKIIDRMRKKIRNRLCLSYCLCCMCTPWGTRCLDCLGYVVRCETCCLNCESSLIMCGFRGATPISWVWLPSRETCSPCCRCDCVCATIQCICQCTTHGVDIPRKISCCGCC